jgi:Flp pilus assembly protein TadG
MKQFRNRFSFAADRKGATAVIYALCLLPIIMVVGFAIDATRISSARQHMQHALDAAVLSGAMEIVLRSTESPADQQLAADEKVQTTFSSDVATAYNHLAPSPVAVTFTDLGGVQGRAIGNLPLVFGGFFGRPSVDIEVHSAAEANDNRRIEVVLALDNTSSMFDSGRFTKMREASKGFVNTMFDRTPSEGLVAVGVVPWAAVVNINSERPRDWDNEPASGGTPPVSGSGRSPNAPFESRSRYLYAPESATPYTAADMARDFAPVDWRGCIRSAPNERRVSGGGSVSGHLTDDPVSGMRWHASWVEPELQAWWVPPPGWTPGPSTPGPTPPTPPVPGPQGLLLPGLPNVPSIANASLTVPSTHRLMCSQSSKQGGMDGLRNVYLNETQPCAKNWQDPFNGEAEACVSDPNEFDYFSAGGKACKWQSGIFPWTSSKPVSGPNLNCPTAMMGLSSDRGQIVDKLNAMYPVPGGTQADIGLMWGLRALSPRDAWKSFFGTNAEQAPKEFDDKTARKIMILLTDGKNEAPYHFEGYYGCNEGDSRGAAGPCWKAPGVSGLNRAGLDALMLDSCEAIRDDYDVELYTIAVDIDDADATSLLADCAGDEDRAFNIRSSELDKAFEKIAARELRLTK